MGVFVGTINVPSSTGNLPVTGIGFQPVAVMFFSVEADQANPSNFYGCSSGPGEDWCMWTGMDDQASTYDRRYHELRDDSCVYNLSSPNFTSVNYKATMVSLDADGFTLNFSEPTAAEPVSFMAIGGSHVPAAHAGTVTAGASTGTTAITAPGFQPTALITAWGKGASANTSLVPDMAWGIGVSDGSNHYSSFAMGDQGGTGVVGYSIHRLDEIACVYDGTNTYRMALQSFDASGFTVNVTDAWTGNLVHGYLAIQADRAVAGNGVQPDATGTQTFATSGLEPGGVLFCWPGVDTPSTSGTSAMPVRPGVGAMTDATGSSVSLIHRASTSFGAYVPDAYRDSPEAINMRGQGNQVDPNVHAGQGLAEFSAFAPGSFTINWTTVTSGADRAYGWLALPGELPFIWIPKIYRRVLPG